MAAYQSWQSSQSEGRNEDTQPFPSLKIFPQQLYNNRNINSEDSIQKPTIHMQNCCPPRIQFSG